MSPRNRAGSKFETAKRHGRLRSYPSDRLSTVRGARSLTGADRRKPLVHRGRSRNAAVLQCLHRVRIGRTVAIGIRRRIGEGEETPAALVAGHRSARACTAISRILILFVVDRSKRKVVGTGLFPLRPEARAAAYRRGSRADSACVAASGTVEIASDHLGGPCRGRHGSRRSRSALRP